MNGYQQTLINWVYVSHVMYRTDLSLAGPQESGAIEREGRGAFLFLAPNQEDHRPGPRHPRPKAPRCLLLLAGSTALFPRPIPPFSGWLIDCGRSRSLSFGPFACKPLSCGLRALPPSHLRATL